MRIRPVLIGCLLAGIAAAELTHSPAVAAQADSFQTTTAAGAPAVLPSLREWTGGYGVFRITPRSRIVVQPEAWQVLRETALTFSEDLGEESGLTLAVQRGSPAPGDIYLSLHPSGNLGSEGYEIEIGSVARLAGSSADGVFYATQTIEQILKADPHRMDLPRGAGQDWPDQAVRAQMIDVGRKFFPVDYLKSQIRVMAWEKLNALYLHFTEWEGFRIRVPAFPGLASAQSYSASDIHSIEEYARRYHVRIIPEIDLPAHATAISKYDPTLAFACPSLAYSYYTGGNEPGWTLDITSQHTLDFIHQLLDQIIPMFEGSVLHVGGDEYQLDDAKAACPELVAYQKRRGFAFPGDVFVDFMNSLDAQIRAHGKTMEMYGWWQFGGQQTSIQPNKDIIIDSTGPLIPLLTSSGYKVMSIDLQDLYITPGIGQKLGDYGYFDIQNVYENVAFPAIPGLLGYRVSRWSDFAEQQSPAWFDFFAHRPLQVFSERVWGGPHVASVWDELGRADGIGAPPPDELVAVPKGEERVIGFDSESNGLASNVIDNDPYTIWESSLGASPAGHQITLDLGRLYRVGAVSYLPRQDGSSRGRVANYELFVSTDASHWRLERSGTFADDQTEKTVAFPPVRARFVKFVALSSTDGSSSASAAEITAWSAPASPWLD